MLFCFPPFSLYPSAQAVVILGGRSENRMFWCRWYCNSRWEERKIFWPETATPTPGCEWKLAESTEQKHLQSHPSNLYMQFNSSQNWNILEKWTWPSYSNGINANDYNDFKTNWSIWNSLSNTFEFFNSHSAVNFQVPSKCSTSWYCPFLLVILIFSLESVWANKKDRMGDGFWKK